MTDPDKTLPQDYFDRLYAGDPDPWKFTSSPYEAAKYAETLDVLPRPRYGRALEVGCSIGELTFQLADRCDSLLAVDLAEAALATARQRNSAHKNVTFLKAAFPDEMPAGPFDFVLLSEVLYYLSEQDLARGARMLAQRLSPGADVLLVHWLGETPDYPLNGDQAAESFMTAARPALSIVRQLRRELYRVDLLTARP